MRLSVREIKREAPMVIKIVDYIPESFPLKHPAEHAEPASFVHHVPMIHKHAEPAEPIYIVHRAHHANRTPASWLGPSARSTGI